MKDIIERSKIKLINLPRKLTINKVDVYNKFKVANGYNDFFTSISKKLVKHLKNLSMKVIMDSKPLSINE